jgi:flagella basal body P-ring formation protein FlgA
MNLFLQIVMFGLLASSAAAGPVKVSIAFRDSAIVNDTVVRFGDIATITSDASADKIDALNNAVVGESAPPGYSRKVSCADVVSFVMKKAGPDAKLSCVTKRNTAVIVATASVEKKVGDFENLIVKYISDSVKWQTGDFTVTVRNTEEKWKCLDRPIKVQAAGLSSKYPKGNLNIRLIARQGSRVYSVPVVCLVNVVTPVIIAKTPISRGTVLSAENCVLERKDITHFASNPFTGLSQVNDLVANRMIQPETILHEKLTSRMPIIGKDEQVYVIVDRGQVRVSIIMRAREQGALGDKIWVENELTHKLIKTKIIGKGKVELLEGVKSI